MDNPASHEYWLMPEPQRANHEAMSDRRAISTSMVGTDAWVAPHGEIDISNVAHLETALTNAASRSHRYVFVDLAEVTFIDAATVGAIVRSANLLNSQGRRLKLLGASSGVQHVLDITGVAAFLGIDAHLLDQPQTAE
jgi:anti-sigma B factor antagonist